MDQSILFSLVLPVLVAVAVASRGFRVDEEYVARWANSGGLELTDDSLPVVRRYLTWSRRSRTVGGLVGFLAPVLYTWVARVALDLEALTQRDTGGWSLLLMFVGYLLGSLIAELVINRPGQQPGPTVPGSRRLSEYLTHYLVVTQRGLGLICAALIVAYAVLALLVPKPGPGIALVAIFGSVGVGMAAVLEVLQRVIIGRRQSVTGPEDRAVDDAMRSSSVHLVAGAGIAILIFFATILLTGVLFLVESRAGVVSFALMLFLFPLSIFFWLDAGKPHGFKVRRTESHLMRGEVS